MRCTLFFFKTWLEHQLLPLFSLLEKWLVQPSNKPDKDMKLNIAQANFIYGIKNYTSAISLSSKLKIN